MFNSNDFVSHILEHNQKLSYCRVNTHHKSGAAEGAIRTVSEDDRAHLLHASMHWKDGVSSELRPMDVDYDVYLYNHLQNTKVIAPSNLFTRVTSPRHKLKDCHVWRAPVYVLDPKLQARQKLPRWQPHSRIGMFVGFRKTHSSSMPSILNIRTLHISPQFHVVFDDDSIIVPSMVYDNEPPSFWNTIDLE